MSSPDAPDRPDRFGRRPLDRFDRLIDQAARALRRPAPEGMLERIRARAADPDRAIDAAARALPGRAPLDAFDVRIAATARSLRGRAPAGMLATIRTRARRARLVLLRGMAAAAVLLVALAWWIARAGGDARAAHPALLGSAALQRSHATEAQLEGEAAQLAERVASLQGGAALEPGASDDLGQSLREEIAFLDEAIAACRAALELSPAHSHLRERLVGLVARRNGLLQILAAGAAGGGPDGAPRG